MLASAGAAQADVALSGAHRIRYETLDSQFRSGYTGGDQALVMRTNVRVDVRFAHGSFTAEVMDSRATLNDEGSWLSATVVNALEPIQAALRFDLATASRGNGTLAVGLLTKDLGSRRLISRNRFRNSVNAFAGLDWDWLTANGGRIDLFYLRPTRILPDDPDALLGNHAHLDDISGAVFAGAFLELPPLRGDMHAQFLLVDRSGPETRTRAPLDLDLTTLSARVTRAAAPARWDFDLELALQGGRVLPTGAPALDQNARMLHGTLGFTVDARWQPRIALEYDYASGDDDPGDDDSERFDWLYGSRRFEFGPSGIFGPFLRSNVSSLGTRANLAPTEAIAVMVAYRDFRLASATDAWVAAGVRDPRGLSGRDIGRQLEAVLTWSPQARRVAIEGGLAHLRYGRFALTAPGASGAKSTSYVYTQCTIRFGT